MKKELIEKVGIILPTLGLVSVTFIIIENIKVRSQNKVLTAKVELQDAALGLSNMMLDGYDDQVKILINEIQSLKESTETKKKKA